MARDRIGAIDGLRAVAMTMVIAQHCGLFHLGWTGVWLFFVISGYVITGGFMQGAYEADSRSAAFSAFMRKRAVRIVPVYVLYVVAGTAVVVTFGPLERLYDVPHLLAFVYNWHMTYQFLAGLGDWSGFFGHLWTLSVEQQFYLLFPLLALFVPRHRQVAVCVGLILAGPFVRWGYSSALAALGIGDDSARAFAVYAATMCHVDAFLIGSLIARQEPAIRSSRCIGMYLWCAAFAVVVAYVGIYFHVNILKGAEGIDMLRGVVSGVLYGEHREVFVYLAVDLAAAAMLVHVLRNGWGTAGLAWRPIAWVGRISYGGYLFHALVLWAIAPFVFSGPLKEVPITQRLLLFAIAWAITVALASASYRWFESPLARRWLSVRRAGQVDQPKHPVQLVGGAR